MTSRDATFWKEAVNDEMESIMSNNTWIVLIYLQVQNLQKINRCLEENTILRVLSPLKQDLVVEGFKQKEGMNYFDIYALAARRTSIRTLMALASIYELYVHQMDVKTTFLNGDIREEVYME